MLPAISDNAKRKVFIITLFWFLLINSVFRNLLSHPGNKVMYCVVSCFQVVSCKSCHKFTNYFPYNKKNDVHLIYLIV